MIDRRRPLLSICPRPNVEDACSQHQLDVQDDMLEAGEEVIKILDSKMGAGSLVAATDVPSGDAFQKFYAQVSHRYDPQYGGYSEVIDHGFRVASFRNLRMN